MLKLLQQVFVGFGSGDGFWALVGVEERSGISQLIYSTYVTFWYILPIAYFHVFSNSVISSTTYFLSEPEFFTDITWLDLSWDINSLNLTPDPHTFSGFAEKRQTACRLQEMQGSSLRELFLESNIRQRTSLNDSNRYYSIYRAMKKTNFFWFSRDSGVMHFHVDDPKQKPSLSTTGIWGGITLKI